jgi:hypothetical protein
MAYYFANLKDCQVTEVGLVRVGKLHWNIWELIASRTLNSTSRKSDRGKIGRRLEAEG